MKFSATKLWITLSILLASAVIIPQLPFAKSVKDPLQELIEVNNDPSTTTQAEISDINTQLPQNVTNDSHQVTSIKDFKVTTNKKGYLNLAWEILATHEVEQQKVKPNETLKKYLDKKVSISGFPIPLDFNNKDIKEFLLVPYFPNCMHVPPPPINQIMHITFKKGQKLPEVLSPLSVEGVFKLSTKAIESSGAFYVLEAESMKIEKTQ